MHGKRWIPLLIIVAVAVVVLGGLFARRGRGETIAYRTEATQRGELRVVVSATGTLNPVTTVLVGSQVSGTIAALNATLASYVEGRADDEIPVWRMLSLDLATLKRRARRWAAAAGEAGSVVPSRSMVGGGSLPGEGKETWCAAIRPPGGAGAFARALRAGQRAIVARIVDDALLLDPRTVPASDDGAVLGAIRAALRGKAG